jgi:DNA-binding GntR family transcriptional regulator
MIIVILSDDIFMFIVCQQALSAPAIAGMKVVMNRPVLTPPVPHPLRQQVTDNLRAAIANCEFEPGGRLTERELCETLNVSRSTIRESLRQLESEGLVRMAPNKGPMIAALSPKEARDIYVIREQLESYAFALCAGRVTPQMLTEARVHLTAIKTAERAGNFPALQTAKTAFYDLLFSYTGNPQLCALLKQLRARCALTRATDRLRSERMAESRRGAEELFAAIRAKDPAAASTVAVNHLQRATALAIAALHHDDGRQSAKLA